MTQVNSHETYPDTHHDLYSKTVFGFWVYLLTDFILFGTLFASYIVLKDGTFGGPSAKDLFHLPIVFIQALLLLTCSLTSGLGSASGHRKHKRDVLIWFGLTFLLGLIFVIMQFSEFARIDQTGGGWSRSAFLSAYFTLVGTHFLHCLFALLWTLILLFPVLKEKSITTISLRRLTCLRLFWQFLNIVWIFIFTIVYCWGGG